MKTSCIRYSWQVLSLIVFETGCMNLNSTRLYPAIMERNVKFNTKSGHGSLDHSLTSSTEDPIVMFPCKMPNSKNTTTFDIQYKPHLTMHYTPNKVYERKSVTVCCCCDSRSSFLEIWSSKNSLIRSSKLNKNVLCHRIIHVSRYDSGVYRCFADFDIGIVNVDVKIVVLYPPDIPNQHINVTETDITRTLQCLADGVPAKYTYGQWEHISYFGQHIRYLQATADGRLILPQMSNKINRYQDNGIYICTASNGVVDSTGFTFQTGKIFVDSNGPPVLVTAIDQKQFGHPGKIFNLVFIVYTKSEIRSYQVTCANKDITASMVTTSVNQTMTFHGTLIYVEATEVVLSFKTSSFNTRHNYTVTLFNGYGNNSYVVEIKEAKKDGKKILSTKIAIIVVSAFMLLCVVMSGIAIFLKRKRNMRHKSHSATKGMAESIEGYPVPVNHRTNDDVQSRDPLTKNADTDIQTCTSETGRVDDVKNRTVKTDVNISEKAVHFIVSRRVMSSDETGYSDVWYK